MAKSQDFVIIKRGRGCVLLYSGYEYYKHLTYSRGETIWSCSKRKKTKCTGPVTVTIDQRSIARTKQHIQSCTADDAQQEIEITLNKCFETAAQGTASVPEAFDKGIVELKNRGIDLAKRLPKYTQKKSAMYRYRNKIAGVSKICAKNPEQVEILKQYEHFLFVDYSCDGVRILVFGCNEAKYHLVSAEHFFMDGTFRSCPKPFIKMYCIHADLGSDINSNNVVPLLYAFMSHKYEKCYTILFELILSQLLWRPLKVTVDFEQAVIKALGNTFPNTIVKGRFYHFSNSIKIKVKALGVKKSNGIVGLCCAMPLLPENMIKIEWKYISDELPCGDIRFKQLQNYITKQWLSKQTTNTIDGWHCKINKKVTKAEVNLLKILPILIDDATLNIVRNDEETAARKRKTANVEGDVYIQNTQMELITGAITVGHFLEKNVWYGYY